MKAGIIVSRLEFSAGFKRWDRSLRTWIKAVREDLLDLEIPNDLWENNAAWRATDHVAEPQQPWE